MDKWFTQYKDLFEEEKTKGQQGEDRVTYDLC